MQSQLTQRLVAVEIIAQYSDIMGRQSRSVFDQPAFARCPFTVLLVMTVLRHEVLGR